MELRVDAMASAGAGDAGEDGSGSAAARIAYEERVLAIEHDALNMPEDAFRRKRPPRHGLQSACFM